ncbi:MAG: ABC transporter ATP-binding protein [Erysipelotrichia bacterium]|jgi:ABC-2 type transport system ATP-binding protein|nr:ABC transporter ATP-binding protein [Erysipelotrichia bacterium]
MIQLKSVTKSFDSTQVLDQVDWFVRKGSVFGLVGPNGAGKSTILRLIAGVITPDHGVVTLEDQPVYDNPLAKQRILFLSDDPFYLHQSTIDEMKEFYKLFYPSFNETMYQRLLNNFPIPLNKKINDFSKGMKRQVGLILALAVNPDVLLLDESFDGLDPVMRLTLKRFIAQEMSNREMTVVISSHNLRELEDICDQVALIDNKKVVMSGQVDTIKDEFHKFQVGFRDVLDVAGFNGLDIIHQEQVGNVFTLVIKGSLDVIKAQLESLDPALYVELPLNLEEIFVYEMEARGYGKSI